MPRTAGLSTPKYRKHRPTGQAVVTIAGKDHYLGPHGTKASIAEYDRLVGEWMAAVLAGVLSDEDAIRAVHQRGRLMQSTGPGAALIVKQTPEALAARLPPDVTLACVNARDLCLVSGRPDAITRFAERLRKGRRECSRVAFAGDFGARFNWECFDESIHDACYLELIQKRGRASP